MKYCVINNRSGTGVAGLDISQTAVRTHQARVTYRNEMITKHIPQIFTNTQMSRKMCHELSSAYTVFLRAQIGNSFYLPFQKLDDRKKKASLPPKNGVRGRRSSASAVVLNVVPLSCCYNACKQTDSGTGMAGKCTLTHPPCIVLRYCQLQKLCADSFHENDCRTLDRRSVARKAYTAPAQKL
jgi:hypothetical protein